MHVLHVSNSIVAGGTELHLLTLCRQLSRRGVRQTVAYLHDRPVTRDLKRDFEDSGIPTVPVGANGRYNMTFPFAVERIVARARPDVLHTHLPRADLAGAFVRIRHRRLPWVVSMHNIYSARTWSGPGLLPVLDVVWRQADGIIAISGAVKEWLVRARGMRSDRVRVIHYGIDPAPFVAPRPNAKERWGLAGRPVVGAMGRLTPHKGFATLISAWAAVRHQIPDAVLLIAGWDVRGYGQELQTLIDALGLHGAARLLGFVEDAPAFFAACDVVALPSTSEGFGQVVIEAMAASRPVVVSRIGPLTEIVSDEETGVLVASGDPAALGAALVRMLTNAEAAAAMGVRARQRVLDQFSASRMAEQTLATYAQLVPHLVGGK